MYFYKVKIYYGPTDSHFTFGFKPQKLVGLRDHLLKMGYNVTLIPIRYKDYCMIEMGGHEVFRCNLSNLCFNTPHHLDPICERALEAINTGNAKLSRARLCLWMRSFVEHMIANPRSEHSSKDYWPYTIESLQKKLSLDPCLDCRGCCLPMDLFKDIASEYYYHDYQYRHLHNKV